MSLTENTNSTFLKVSMISPENFSILESSKNDTLISEKRRQADTRIHPLLTPGSNNNDLNPVEYLRQQLTVFYYTYSKYNEVGDITEEYVKKLLADCCLQVDSFVGNHARCVLKNAV